MSAMQLQWGTVAPFLLEEKRLPGEKVKVSEREK